MTFCDDASSVLFSWETRWRFWRRSESCWPSSASFSWASTRSLSIFSSWSWALVASSFSLWWSSFRLDRADIKASLSSRTERSSSDRPHTWEAPDIFKGAYKWHAASFKSPADVSPVEMSLEGSRSAGFSARIKSQALPLVSGSAEY